MTAPADAEVAAMNDAIVPLTRIQQKNRDRILRGALEAFSASGFHGATLDQIARAAGLSKPNMLYYFASKDEIYKALLTALLDTWLAPMQRIDPEGEPLAEILAYIQAKLRMSRDYPRESRLFAHEILQGAPHLNDVLGGRLREVVDKAVDVLEGWMTAGRLAPADPRHLIFSIWSMTQHYADFETQVRAVLGPHRDPIGEGAVFLDGLYRRLLTP